MFGLVTFAFLLGVAGDFALPRFGVDVASGCKPWLEEKGMFAAAYARAGVLICVSVGAPFVRPVEDDPLSACVCDDVC